MTRRRKTVRSFRPSTRITTLKMRRRIHDAKTIRARYFAAQNRGLVSLSLIALQMATWIHNPHVPMMVGVR